MEDNDIKRCFSVFGYLPQPWLLLISSLTNYIESIIQNEFKESIDVCIFLQQRILYQ